MKTPAEQERCDVFNQAVTAMIEGLTEAFGEAAPIHEMVGTAMALIDATFAIRDGEEWRGMTDPQDIARRILRDLSLGE